MVKVQVLGFWQSSLEIVKRILRNETGTLAFSVKNVITHGFGGMKVRLVKVTFDAAYATPGYTVTPANCKLKTKILSCSSAVIGVFTVSPTLSGNDVILQCIKGAAGVNAECSSNESGLENLVGMFTVWGY